MKQIFLLLLVITFGCKQQPTPAVNSEIINSDALVTFEDFLDDHQSNFFKRMGKVQPGDWLSEHQEKGQTFQEYLNSNPSIVDSNRNTIYLQPLGEFNHDDSLLLTKTSVYLKEFYGLNVTIKTGWKLDKIDSTGKRIFFGELQLLTTYILYDLLKPNLPNNAVAYMAITPVDLYPKEDWHFVFGQASIKDRVGVSSLNRLKAFDEKNNLDFNKSFRRITKTTSHEIGHMFSLKHCTKYRCNMNGSNRLSESDLKPMWLCPQCIDKVSHATDRSIEGQCKSLLQFHTQENMVEKEHYKKLINIIDKHYYE